MRAVSLLVELVLIALWLRMIVWHGLACMATLRARRRAPKGQCCAVSVVVPAYDEAAAIGATLASLKRQSVQPAEVIVIDDGSKDETSDHALAGMCDRQSWRLIRFTQNEGKAAALNAGLAVARHDLVLTLDADTVLAANALERALSVISEADAVALCLRGADNDGFLSRLQAQDYALSLDFERRGQGLVGAIAVLPGAATLLRKSSLPAQPYLARTCTEDADTTLRLHAGGARLVASHDAIAWTEVPVTMPELFRQRTRWAFGHMQCIAANFAAGKTRSYRGLVLSNFIASTFAAPLVAGAGLWILATGQTPLLQLGWWQISGLALAVVYSQRLSALALVPGSWRGMPVFILEPLAIGFIQTVCAFKALFLCGGRAIAKRRKAQAHATSPNRW